ncbi:MAG: hypothetical protein P4L35_16015 [Ignavibacteriaceae bacterium]|nr:hypothetical protein [Ignavibacteriaceae bacterium]
MNDNFKVFSQFLGLGKVNSKLWFVEIEEYGETIKERGLADQLKYRSEQRSYFNNAPDKSPVWKAIVELLYQKYSKSNKPSMGDFRKELFLDEEHSHFFLTDLMPLPQSNPQDWSDKYKKLFGYGKDDYLKYLSDVRSTRYPIIYRKWKEVKPRVTVCFGSSHWDEYVNLFNLGHSSFEVLNGHRYFPGENIYLVQFRNDSMMDGERELLGPRIGS